MDPQAVLKNILEKYKSQSNTDLYELIRHELPFVTDVQDTFKFCYNGDIMLKYSNNLLTYSSLYYFVLSFYQETGNFFEALDKLFGHISQPNHIDRLKFKSPPLVLSLDERGEKFSYYINKLICTKCFDLFHSFHKNDNSDILSNCKIMYPEKYDDLVNFLSNNELDQLPNLFKNDKKILYIRVIDSKARGIYYIMHYCSYKNCVCDTHINETNFVEILYISCVKCFKYYIKLLDIFERYEVNEFTMNFSGYDKILNLVNENSIDCSFIQHICEGNNLMNLLKFIETQYMLPIPINEIVNLCVNANDSDNYGCHEAPIVIEI